MSMQPDERRTRHLDLPEGELYSPPRATTGPLEEELPWVIEFRIVGTPATIQVQVHESMLIGRSDPQSGIYPAVDLSAHSAQANGVSRQHAAIIAKDNRIKVKDLGSVNGTRLNGYALEPHHEYRLRHGDELQVGQVKLQVRFAVVPTIDSGNQDTQPTTHASIPVVGRGENVLIVEDDSDVGKVFKIALEHAGLQVTLADTAERALAHIMRQMPDVIVMDVMLPDMNGLDLVSYVRKQGYDVPMIVCSGATGGFHINKAREVGANAFLTKPVSMDELLRAISEVITPADAVSF
jgi:CheY-like chemotaxis protein